MFINNFDPVAIEIFSLEIRWYSLAYIAGILIGWYLAKKVFINNNIKDRFDDYVTYVIIGLILGGRLGYVLFYNLDHYLSNFLDIFKIWQGGMSFHGGVIGIIISSILFSKKDDESVKDSLDTVIKYLDKKKIQYFFDENSSILLKKNNYSSIEDIKNSCDIAFIIGGDGTLLRSAQELSKANTIPSEKLKAISFGETKPLEQNDTRQGREKNRRIEIEIKY